MIQHYGLWAVVIGAFFQGQIFLVCAGILASQSVFSPLDVWVSATIGAWVGHLFWFYFGKNLSTRSLRNYIPNYDQNLNRVNLLIQKYPCRSVFFLQYLYGLRLVGAIGFGFSRIPILWFSLAQLINCTIWAGLLAMIGYFAGEFIEHGVLSGLKYAWIAFTLILVAYVFRKMNKDQIEDTVQVKSSEGLNC